VRKIVIAAVMLVSCLAEGHVTFSSLKGWTIGETLTVIGYCEKGKCKTNGEFQGCDHDRVILFEGNKKASCDEYSYSYSYRPEATILWYRGTLCKMVVDDEVYDISC
jgi:hypothetical protein